MESLKEPAMLQKLPVTGVFTVATAGAVAGRFPRLATGDLHFVLTSAELQVWLDELRCKQGQHINYRQAVHTAAGPQQPAWTYSHLPGQATLCISHAATCPTHILAGCAPCS